MRGFRRTRSSLVLAACLFALGAAPALADPVGAVVTHDGPHGPWFKRSCGFDPHRASCNAQVVTDDTGVPLASGSPLPGSLGPAQLHGAYALPTAPPTAQTVAIVDAYDDPNISSDLATFDAAYGLPALTPGAPGCSATGCFEKVNENGGLALPPADPSWAMEIALDVESVHEICETCSIVLVEASSATYNDLATAENEAAALGANVITNSWGGGEWGGETSFDSAFDHPGVAITASAGDSGYGVEYPAASPYVTAVGGTTLTLGSGNTYAGETAWSGSGSGCSTVEPKPSWQTDSGCTRRTVADVAADADPQSGAAIYDSVSYNGSSGWMEVGGTSLAAQIVGAVEALTGQAAQSSPATPYAHASLLHDVLSGNDGTCAPSYLCTAGSGYDGPTGLGTPNGLGAFEATTVAAAPDFALTATPASGAVAPGGSAGYTISVTPKNGFAGSIAISLALPLPGGVGAAFTPSATAASPATVTLNTLSSTTPGTYQVTVIGTSGSLSHSVTLTLVVSAPAPPPTTTAVSARLLTTNSTHPCNGNTCTTASFTADAGATVLVVVDTGAPNDSVTSIGGAAISGATQLTSLRTSSKNELAVWQATGTGAAGALTVGFAVKANPGIVDVIELSGNATTNPVAQTNPVTGASGVAVASLANPSSANGELAVVAVAKNTPLTGPPGFTALDTRRDGANGGYAYAVYFAPAAQASATATPGDQHGAWGTIALELAHA
ncbi:MAG: S53 family peptidase [Actinobacteria bacterium]|nr:S53 family peptidase [Actinomycetota bacterium]